MTRKFLAQFGTWLWDFLFPVTLSKERLFAYIANGAENVTLSTDTQSQRLFSSGSLTGSTPFLYVRASAKRGQRGLSYEYGVPFHDKNGLSVFDYQEIDLEEAEGLRLDREQKAYKIIVALEKDLRERWPELPVTVYKPFSVMIAEMTT